MTATFGDFALAGAVPSYGGAEVLRAQRVLEGPGGSFGVPVHLALFGPAAQRERLVEVAATAATNTHDQVARIMEVGRYDDTLYAVAAPAEGTEIAAVLELERRKKAVPDVALCVSVALQLGQIAIELHERGDVWAAAGGTGLSALFPAGLRLDALVLSSKGVLTVRILAGAAGDPAKPSAFRAPELRRQRATVASDVFVVGQTLRALLTGDASATSAPRFAAAAAPLGPVLASALAANPDERTGLFMLVERLGIELVRLAGKGSKADAVAAAFLKREYKQLAPEPSAGAPMIGPDNRKKLVAARKKIELFWPATPSQQSGEDFDIDVEGMATTEVPRRLRHETSSAVGRVFDDLSDISRTEPPQTKPFAVARVRVEKTIAITRNDEPPWLSASEDAELIEASAAPLADASDIESGPTVETRTLLDIDADETDDSTREIARRPQRKR